MQTRREQVQAHRFVVSRLTTGLMRTDPDAPESPNRRTNRGMALGGALSAVVAVGFLVFGFISPGGSTDWQDPKTLIVEEGTGNRFLYDGSLRPVLNYASAKLIVGADLTTSTEPQDSLADTAHGSSVGIPGAPDTLPPASSLDQGAWEVCATTQATDSGERTSATDLVVDGAEPGMGLGDDQALLVSGPDKTYYLLWHGNRYRLASGAATADALGYGTADPLPVTATYLDALPAGADLAPPDVPGQGDAGPELDGHATRLGQVFSVQTPGSDQQYYLLTQDGLVPVTATQAALSLSGPGIRDKVYGGAAPVAVTITADALNGVLVHGGSAIEDTGAELPATPPTLVPVADGQAACVRLDAGGGTGSIGTGGGTGAGTGGGGTGAAAGGGTGSGGGTGAGTGSGSAATGRTTGSSISIALVSSATLTASAKAPTATACLPVDAVVVPPGGGSLVRALGAGGTQIGATTYLVTETGEKYLIPDQTAATDLGYDLADARGLPAQLLAMVPTGPDLSPADAVAGQASITAPPGCPTEDAVPGP